MTLEPLLHASPVIQIHAAAAVAAFGIGGVVLFNRKGTARHKVLGRVWVVLMAIVAVSSFFIWQIRMFGLFSPIHILSVVTLAGLWRAITFARARNIRAHKLAMQNTYLGALVVAGFFTFMPGRIMNSVIFGQAGADAFGWALFLGTFGAAIVLGYIGLRRRMGWKLPLVHGPQPNIDPGL